MLTHMLVLHPDKMHRKAPLARASRRLAAEHDRRRPVPHFKCRKRRLYRWTTKYRVSGCVPTHLSDQDRGS